MLKNNLPTEAGQNNDSLADDSIQPESGYNRNKLTKSQKIAAASLAFFAFLVIVLWLAQFKKSLSQPFAPKTQNIAQGQDAAAANAGELTEAQLRAKDTDRDGLSDWDELYFYKTSPYLEDSDSDGFKDKDEINNDKDPNCPAGRDCVASGLVNGDSAVTTAGTAAATSSQDISSLHTLLNQLGYGKTAPAKEPASATNSAANLNALLSGQIDAATLRQLLLEKGMDKKILDQISDEQLLASFQEMMKSQ